jgi:hypothetical protein
MNNRTKKPKCHRCGKPLTVNKESNPPNLKCTVCGTQFKIKMWLAIPGEEVRNEMPVRRSSMDLTRALAELRKP